MNIWNHNTFVFFVSQSFRNPQVQLKGLHLGFVQSLIRLIHDENDEQMKIRLIYPLSTLLRNFPQGQKQFLDYGGAETMKNLLDSNQSSNQLAIRTMTLMNDLIVEKVKKSKVRSFFLTWRFLFQRQATVGRKIAYENLRLFDELVERGWCSALVNRLELLDLKSFDFVEKILDAFVSFRDECRKDFEKVRPIFNEIDEIYSKLNVDDESLYDEILQNLSSLREISTRKSSEELWSFFFLFSVRFVFFCFNKKEKPDNLDEFLSFSSSVLQLWKEEIRDKSHVRTDKSWWLVSIFSQISPKINADRHDGRKSSFSRFFSTFFFFFRKKWRKKLNEQRVMFSQCSIKNKFKNSKRFETGRNFLVFLDVFFVVV